MDAQSGSMSSWDYLDFELEIRESESRGYAVAVHSPAGEAQEEMSFPFDERQLRDKLKDLEIALLRSGGTRRYPLYDHFDEVRRKLDPNGTFANAFIQDLFG